ncbi:MAG: glycoside hydrolase family 3 protein [Clostridia bacterium]|nr:glycoside hydrolase family 3 protein [Clostridia bacterium]
MANFRQKIDKIIAKAVNSLAQAEVVRKNEPKVITEGMPGLLRYVASQGAVLLENDGALPLKKGTRVSVFGRVQNDWFYTGYGSGGDVNKPYAVNLLEGMRKCEELELNEALASVYEAWCEANPVDHGYWGHWPRFYPEMPLYEKTVKKSAERTDCAVVVIGRSSGEDRENALEKGSYFVTDDELDMLRKVTSEFEKTIVLLNIGSIMDLSWTKEFGNKISALMIVWQGGMESGNAVCDLLCGKQVPSGKLTSTIAAAYDKYPCADSFGAKDFNDYVEDIFVGYRYFETFAKQDVLYPFGYGLSYTTFNTELVSSKETAEGVELICKVTNTGEYKGKQVVCAYMEKPCGTLGNPVRELCAFAKTKELPSHESEEVRLFVPESAFSSYDDSGKSGHMSSYVIEKGSYGIAIGDSVRDAETVYTTEKAETEVFLQLSQCSAPQTAFEKMTCIEKDGKYFVEKEKVQTRKYNLRQIILQNLPKDIPMTGDKGIKLIDVKNGKNTMEEFVAQLSLTELEAITRGDYTMGSELGVPGNAGCFAGVLPSLREKGIPAVTTTDGPSGIRLTACCSLMPIGTLLASSFDTDMVCELMKKEGEEMADKGSDIILAPGMNIHRSPLCGRNFEYFSEDPHLCGKIAAAYVRGIQSTGRSACPKHFACNNQEYNRARNDSRLSERALREIYLKGFEICVKEAQPKNIMTSYNLINGVWGHYNYELCTRILREEWGYKGNVMTDWWMKKSKSQEFPNMCDQAYRVRAQVDVLMPGGGRTGKWKRPDGTLLRTYGKPEGITLGEMQRCAMNVLNFAMNKVQ